jgi:hypothetical protein
MGALIVAATVATATSPASRYTSAATPPTAAPSTASTSSQSAVAGFVARLRLPTIVITSMDAITQNAGRVFVCR